MSNSLVVYSAFHIPNLRSNESTVVSRGFSLFLIVLEGWVLLITDSKRQQLPAHVTTHIYYAEFKQWVATLTQTLVAALQLADLLTKSLHFAHSIAPNHWKNILVHGKWEIVWSWEMAFYYYFSPSNLFLLKRTHSN